MKAFSEELIRQRARRGWTRAMQVRKFLAVRDQLRIRAVTNNPENISRNFLNWERGVVPDPLSQVVLAVMHGRTLIGLFGEDAALNHLGLTRPGLMDVTGGRVELPHFARAEDDPMERRLFVAWLMRLSAGAVVLPTAVRRTTGLVHDDPDLLPRITMRDVAELDACHTTFMTLNFAVGAVARKAVLGQLSYAVDQLKAGVPGRTEALNSWRILTARLADTACWMSVDAGRIPQAQALAGLSCEVVASIEGRQTADAASGYFMSKLAELALVAGRPRTALELADQAESIARGASAMTCHAIHAIKAEACAGLGDVQGTRRALGLAEKDFSDTSVDEVEREPWAWHYRGTGRYHYHRGSAQARLVQTRPELSDSALVRDACDTLTRPDAQGIAQRHSAQAKLRAATTLLIGREPEEAVRVGRQALPVLPVLRSARVRDDVHDVEQAAGPFRRRPEVADLLHDLSGATV